MPRKPWPIIFLGVLHLLEPFAKVALYSVLWKTPLWCVVDIFLKGPSYKVLTCFLSYPIAGIAILKVRPWSLPVVFLVSGLNLFIHFQNSAINPQQYPWVWIVLVSMLNLSLVLYFLLPKVQLPYLDPRVRWWERSPRYVVNWPCQVHYKTRSLRCEIQNFSKGGALVSGQEPIDLNYPCEIEFDFNSQKYSLPGTIISVKSNKDRYGIAIQFAVLDKSMAVKVKHCLNQIKYQYPKLPQSQTYLTFLVWLRGALHGRGLVPEVRKPAHLKAKDRKAS